ncbi:hypothetical protein TVAG_024000 [Trichomonas vaginalis G3]|uniref:Uncharacterized protein n=1 Tax=Trichomonas vaginalis (strain ATCC PRA-98 / G3) TaxID=412133 RepID=A2G436_TRIV3|nr:hypothetical protein TVAGG3_0279980 [Trichomonas vaginalis G3]EAX88085.1 hypothetical protein TVAG_024000 [Trichomonas vaginalis G3]KAI5526479.1 hypothetical protein TVAGG3_0279980 [Trichomonas vaginalis G3]|eukprot:XP_001301015.1 hypothetical protein [Trichomonas vaginalis G3]
MIDFDINIQIASSLFIISKLNVESMKTNSMVCSIDLINKNHNFSFDLANYNEISVIDKESTTIQITGPLILKMKFLDSSYVTKFWNLIKKIFILESIPDTYPRFKINKQPVEKEPESLTSNKYKVLFNSLVPRFKITELPSIQLPDPSKPGNIELKTIVDENNFDSIFPFDDSKLPISHVYNPRQYSVSNAAFTKILLKYLEKFNDLEKYKILRNQWSKILPEQYELNAQIQTYINKIDPIISNSAPNQNTRLLMMDVMLSIFKYTKSHPYEPFIFKSVQYFIESMNSTDFVHKKYCEKSSIIFWLSRIVAEGFLSNYSTTYLLKYEITPLITDRISGMIEFFKDKSKFLTPENSELILELLQERLMDYNDWKIFITNSIIFYKFQSIYFASILITYYYYLIKLIPTIKSTNQEQFNNKMKDALNANTFSFYMETIFDITRIIIDLAQ